MFQICQNMRGGLSIISSYRSKSVARGFEVFALNSAAQPPNDNATEFHCIAEISLRNNTHVGCV
jgi:hypothetical protein